MTNQEVEKEFGPFVEVLFYDSAFKTLEQLLNRVRADAIREAAAHCIYSDHEWMGTAVRQTLNNYADSLENSPE